MQHHEKVKEMDAKMNTAMKTNFALVQEKIQIEKDLKSQLSAFKE